MDSFEFFNTFNYWHWFALAVILAISDVLVGANFVLVWSGLAAVVVGLCKWGIPTLSWQWQFLLFGIGVFASILFWRHWLKHRPKQSHLPHLNQRARHYLGRSFTLDAPIVDGHGKVKVDDSIWRIQGPSLPAGARVRVIDVEGVILKVEAIPVEQ